MNTIQLGQFWLDEQYSIFDLFQNEYSFEHCSRGPGTVDSDKWYCITSEPLTNILQTLRHLSYAFYSNIHLPLSNSLSATAAGS